MTPNMKSRKVVALIAATIVLAAVAVGVATTILTNPDDPLPEIALGAGLDRFPSEDLSYWVTYPTQISVVTVVSEAEIPPPARVTERGEGYVGRTVELRIDRTLWATPDVEAQTGNVELVAFGWLRKGDTQIPFGPMDGHRLEVGGRYIIPFVPDEGAWGWLTSSAILEIDSGDRIALDQGRIKNPASLAQKGATLDEFTMTLMNTAPDPAAAPFAHLPPDKRIEAVFDATPDG